MIIAPHAHASLISIGVQQAGVFSGGITTLGTDFGTGFAAYTGAYGSFVFNNITATGAPIMSQGNLDTTSLDLSGPLSGAATINVFITEQGLTSPTGMASFLSSFTSNAFNGSAVSVTETTYLSGSNQMYAGTQMATTAFTGLGSTAFTTAETLASPYSETVEYTITKGMGSASVNDTIDLTVSKAVAPEPSSLVLLGTGLIGAATTVLRRRKLVA